MNLDFVVQGMTCNHCRGAVIKALEAVDGVTEVSVDLESGASQVKGSEGLELAKIKSAVEEAGYVFVAKA